MASKSSFYDDGYSDASKGLPFSPPDVPVFAAEYKDGYDKCVTSDHRFDPELGYIVEAVPMSGV